MDIKILPITTKRKHIFNTQNDQITFPYKQTEIVS